MTVRYPEGWKSATGPKTVDQIHALAKYFEHQHLSTWVYRCIVLQGISALPISNGKADTRGWRGRLRLQRVPIS